MDAQALHITRTMAAPSNGSSRSTQTQAQPGSTLIYRAPSRTVRSNWLYYLRTSWQRISRTSKVILGTTLLIGFAQIIVTFAILIIGKNEICDKPLDIYLIVFLVRLGFSLPLTLYQYLRPSGFNDGSNQSISTTTSQQAVETTTPSSIANSTSTTSVSQDRNSIRTLPLSSTSTAPNTLENTLSTGNPSSISNASTSSPSDNINNAAPYIEHPPYRSTIMRSSWLDRFKSLLDLISILWFVVGNYMIFTASEQCHRDANYLFYTTMTWILLGYFLVLIPLLLCVAVVFCLPCLLVAMRVMNVDYATGMVGANKNEIQAIPIYKYTSSPSTDHHSDSCRVSLSSPNRSTATLPPAEKKKNGIMAHFISSSSSSFSYHNKHHRNDTDEESGFEEWTMDPTDASCTICLSDYENGDLVCRLRCNHHFHKDCVHEWLSLNYKCPLCQRDFRKDKAHGDETD